jgi:hypothetical protein
LSRNENKCVGRRRRSSLWGERLLRETSWNSSELEPSPEGWEKIESILSFHFYNVLQNLAIKNNVSFDDFFLSFFLLRSENKNFYHTIDLKQVETRETSLKFDLKLSNKLYVVSVVERRKSGGIGKEKEENKQWRS